jgi:hypothetical protein
MLRRSVRGGPYRGGLESEHASSADYDFRDDELCIYGRDCMVDSCDDDVKIAC